MKKSALVFTFFLSTTAFAAHLHSYNEIKSAVASGKSIRIVIDYAKCTSSAKNTTMPAYLTAFTPNEMVLNQSQGYIAASLMHFTLNNTKCPVPAVYEFVRYTISNDDSVKIEYTPLNPVDYKPLADKTTFDCRIEKSAFVYA